VTEHYVTLFDSSYLPQGLALHRSALRHAGDFHLWIIAMDAPAGAGLRTLTLDRTTVLDLRDVENDALRSVRPTRTRGEYCWTLTPFTPSMVFEREPTAGRVTYLDADLWFAREPDPLFAELERSGKAVMITDHAYSPEHDPSALSGRFCVQFMPFTRRSGDGVLSWWQDRCIEWCYNRFEDGRFGDQKYLDDWPERFADTVHVLEDLPAMQAPWNATRFDAADARVFHFHELRTMSAHTLRMRTYVVPGAHLRAVYRPYLADLRWAVDTMAEAGIPLVPQVRESNTATAPGGSTGATDSMLDFNDSTDLKF
jgi:hypothetical protein